MKKSLRTFAGLFMILAFLLPYAGLSQQNALSPSFGFDIPIFEYSDNTYADTKVSIAENGWIYVLSRVDASGSNYQCWRVWRSTDDGITFGGNFGYICQWEYNTLSWALADVDMVVTGNDPSNIRIYVAEATNSSTSDPYIRITRWDADGNYIDEPYYFVWPNPPDRNLTSIAIASDSRSPGTGGSPYQVSIAWTGSNAAGNDNYVCYAYSLDGGSTFLDMNLTANSTGAAGRYGNISLALGGTNANNWGRYLVAFEMNVVGGLGDIGVMMNYTDNTVSLWGNPVMINGHAGACRFPAVTMMNDVTTSPANVNLIPILVAYEDWFFGASDVDIYTHSLLDTYVINSQATIADFNANLITPYAGNQMQPALQYDRIYDNMLMLYQDNTSLLYQYSYMDNLFPAPGWWQFPNFRDATTPFTAPSYTSLDINLAIGQVGMTWRDNNTVYGTPTAYFDAEWSTFTGVRDVQNTTSNVAVYPNPASETIHIKILQEGTFDLTLTDLSGRELLFKQIKTGDNLIDVTGLNPGMYHVRVIGGKVNETVKLSVR